MNGVVDGVFEARLVWAGDFFMHSATKSSVGPGRQDE